MAWNLDSDRPIYAQLLERIQLQIVSGTYGPGDKLPSVRELAAEASVNPNTMQKAFAELDVYKRQPPDAVFPGFPGRQNTLYTQKLR